MLANKQRNRGWMVLLGLLLGASGTAAQSGSAQQVSDDGGYAVSEAGEAKTPESVPPAGTQENLGPVRLARFSYVQGNVTWRTDENSEWSSATLNLPLRQGAQIWVTEGGRAEIQFDDGSLLRLGTGAVVTLQTLYSDADGEFTELKMTEGLASLRLRHDRGVYQVNTPLGSVKAAGPAALRFGVGDGLEVAVKSGQATIEGAQGKANLESGDFLDLRNSTSAYSVHDIPRPDTWDRWNQDRDDLLARAESQPAQQHLPADIAIVADNLNDYGSWRNDPDDGWVWCPRVSSSDWRPYHDGHWTWVNPFGWTWVSNEAWGWAPYHYGTWVSRSYGWAWCPGPVNQYWSPAVVHFSECNGQVAWCPLAPAEVRYPTTIGFGFRRGNWSTYFSICGAAVYYPTEGGYCAPRVYDTRYVNRVTYVTNVTNITNINNRGNGSFNRFGLSQEAYAANNNTYLNGGRAFVPVNSRTAAGVTVVAGSEFGGRGVYGSAAKADTSWFTRGRAIGAPVQGKAPIAGPIIVKPTQQATTPTRTFANVPQGGPVRQAQPVFRAPVKAAIVQNSAPITSAGRVLPPAPTEFVKPTTGTKYTGGLNRNDRGLPNGNASNNTGNSGLNGQGSPRIQVQPRGNSGQSNADNRVDVKSPRTGYYSDPRSTGGATKGTTNSADAAAQARASLGIPSRTRSNGNATENGNTGNGTRTTNPTNGSSDGFGNRGRTPRYDGTSGGATNDNSAGKSAPTYTQRPNQPTRTEQPQQTAPIRTEQPRQTQPTRTDPGRTEQPRQTQPTRTEQPRQTQPTRTEPTRTEQPRQTQPTRTEPTRTEPTRTEQPRQTPPARETEKTPPASKGNDSGKDSNSKDSTNRGRGRG